MQQQYHQRSQLNELEFDDAWQRGIADRLLIPVLRANSHKNSLVTIPFNSNVSRMLQLQAGVDAFAQLPHGNILTIEIKIVRWPGARQGRPSYCHWRDLFLETQSSSVGPNRQKGWMHTSQADILLWCQCSLHEDWLDCFPFPFSRLRTWFLQHIDKMPERKVQNVIDGRALWTIGRLVEISRVCRRLKVEGFRINNEGVITDLYGKQDLRFLRERAA